MTLSEFNELNSINGIWISGVGYPTGKQFVHDTETEDEHAYCDFNELDCLEQFWNLEGTIEHLAWVWNGEGNIRDERGNTIYNLKAWSDHNIMCFKFATSNQGFTGTYAEWMELPADEREQYELGAAGIPTA